MATALPVTMLDVLPLLGLPYPAPGRRSYYVQCPCCDEGRKKHLNINLEKNVFRCPRCGFNGGVLDLYAFYTHSDRKAAYDAIRQHLHLDTSSPRQPAPLPVRAEEIENPIIDVDARHATYAALLSVLTLASDHRANLLSRGLSEDRIVENGYRTTPAAGFSAIARKLQGQGHYLAGVPGFYRKDGQWTLCCEQRGILIPVRDMEGRIQGLQIRRDNVEKRKYRWLSSSERTDGCKAEGWTHIAGQPRKRIFLTEGPLKADIVHALSGQTVLAVPGVNALTHLDIALDRLCERELSHVYVAFDMDLLINPHVQNGYRTLLQLLSDHGLTFSTCLWDPRQKGIDDYLWAQIQGRRQ